MFYAVRVNFALAGLGINPQWVKAEYRQGAQQIGKDDGYTPEEVALFIAGGLPPHLQREAAPEVARLWIQQGKINLNRPDMRTSLDNLGWLALAADG